ncbi:hypothetical protein ACTQ5F_11015 [Jeotgalibaca porci]|uniref:hypothetical protein n=1 Tax=Jeotgalibaca porci TaxID=1868793 RepID=UPI00359FF24E
MVNINKKLEQLEKIKEEIALEKQKIEQDLGREVITALDLDYDQLNKKEMKDLATQFKSFYDSLDQQSFDNNEDGLKTNATN